MKLRRVLSLALVVVLCLTMLPAVVLNADAATITVFSQTDSRWGSHQYGYSNAAGTTPATISGGGCGILALVNAVYYMNGRFINPITLADWSVKNGYRVNGVGTAHALYPAYSSAYGSTYGFSCNSSAGTSSWDILTSHLRNGGTAIVPTETYATGSAHLLVIADYNAADGTYLVLDSYASSYRGTSSGYAWMTKATFQNRMWCNKFILINNTSGSSGHSTHSYTGSYYEAAHPHKVYQQCSCGATRYTGAETKVSTCGTCNPVYVSNKYNAVLPFKAYLKEAATVYPCSSEHLAQQTGGQIWEEDECIITAVYENGACKVEYPIGNTYQVAYTSLSNFVGNTSASLTKQIADSDIRTYIRANTGTQYGGVDDGDTIYKMGTSGGMTQIFYPTPSGYKLAWVETAELTPQSFDNRFNPHCPIYCYPCATEDFDVYEADHITYIGSIWTTDDCTVEAVYEDGWCRVTYPVGDSTKTGYTKLSNFVSNVSATHVKYTANDRIIVSTTKNLNEELGKIFVGDVFYAVGTSGQLTQVMYPLDAEYGSGYKMGWILTSDLPKNAYTVSYNANGGIGAPAQQTKTHGITLQLSKTIPTRDGYTFVGWATSSTATSADYISGASYATDANVTLYAVWKLKKYEITYNANGGTNAPTTQNKAHGTSLTLSNDIPEKTYTITFDPNGGTVDVANRQGSCEFLGWSISSTETAAAYQPGDVYTANANAALYAVWKNPSMMQYSIPMKAGYVFDGWYTAADGGTQVSLGAVISADMTVYAHWAIATYGVNYDANGGFGAPETQIKTHGENMMLSTTVPNKANYTFLGWATQENPDEVQYQPGDVYSADVDIMLIAVWQCNLNPVICVSNTAGKPGDTVIVAVQLRENPGIIAARLKISYDSSALELMRVADGGILGEYKFGEDLSANPYVVSWSNGLAESDFTTNGDLAYLTFKICENASEGTLPITVSYDTEEIYNKELKNVFVDTESGAVTVEKTGELDGEIVKWNVALADDLLVNFYLNISERIEQTAKVRIYVGENAYTFPVAALEKTEDGLYIARVGAAAAQMNDFIYVSIINSGSTGQTYSYTIRQYADTILADEVHSAYHPLVKEMLNYGAAAQVYFDYEAGNLANEGITGTGGVEIPDTVDNALSLDGKADGISFYGASLIFRDRIAVRYYFSFEGQINNMTFTVNERQYAPQLKDGLYYIEIADILPQDLDQQITLTVTDASGNTLTVTYGPMNYIVRMNEKGSAELQNLLKALYNYHLAAKALSVAE